MGKQKLKLAVLLISILIVVTMFVQNSFAVLLTVDQNIGESDTYHFNFLPITENTLSFDYTFTTIFDSTDPSDPSALPDSFYCNITIGTDIYDLLIADSAGNYPNPLLNAPGMVSVTPSSTPGYSYTMTADITSLAGSSGYIYFELADWGDGYDTTVEFANIKGVNGVSPVPEPATILLIGISLLGGFVFKKRIC